MRYNLKPSRVTLYGALAHLARASDWQSEGDRFESDMLHKILQPKVEVDVCVISVLCAWRFRVGNSEIWGKFHIFSKFELGTQDGCLLIFGDVPVIF